LLPILAAVAQRADGPVCATVDHNDLHPFNVLTRGLRIFDWGDAVVGHPFASLRRALDLAATQPDMLRPAARARLQRAYLEAWAGDVSPADLQEQLRVAPVLGAVAAASTWTRLPPAAVEANPASFPRKLRDLLAHLHARSEPGRLRRSP
jgi:aminoglycoside phosphotransferase (APT) family kinase protein